MCRLLHGRLPAATRSAGCSAASLTSLAARTAKGAASAAGPVDPASATGASYATAFIPARGALALAARPAAAVQPTEPLAARGAAATAQRTRPELAALAASTDGAACGGSTRHGLLC